MYKYGFQNYFEADFTAFYPEVMKGEHWINVYLNFDLSAETKLPGDLYDPSALVVFDRDGEVQDFIVHDEGVDCEYKFTDREKEKMLSYIKKHDLI
ncbi:hypothetical protein [Fictibacillus sp. KU28468]|uniref:hypothetical protein n=1 Tax=Fictibacillus sp. KU28468 TaxID=2991053 RepID=UPI00223E869F|nr:hypothetical protein [Fictibacillus sp. KU28468]UZJ80085.1 hypothetical protein OKX00_06355 [Fictibacillus sp. KU28468]